MEWPKLLPTNEYDLDQDDVHQHRSNNLPAVVVPGHPYQYQHAIEAPVWLWPHNASKLGMARYTPTAQDVAPDGVLALGYNKDDDTTQKVVWAFLYTYGVFLLLLNYALTRAVILTSIVVVVIALVGDVSNGSGMLPIWKEIGQIQSPEESLRLLAMAVA